MPVDVDNLCPITNILEQLNRWMGDNKQRECIELLKNLEKIVYNKQAFYENSLNLLTSACKDELPDLALYIIRKEKTYLEALGDNNSTALMWACSKGLTKVVKELLKYKCGAHMENSNGDTALIFAADRFNVDILLILINYAVNTGGNINEFQVNDNNDTVLDMLLTDDYKKHINKPAYIKCINWLISRYQETDPSSEVLQRNIDRICADPELKARIKINCSRPRRAEAVVGVEVGKKLGSPKTRSQKEITNKRVTAKHARELGISSAKAIPLALAVREQTGEDTGFYVDFSDDEGERLSPRR
jgi:hypothetical protein